MVLNTISSENKGFAISAYLLCCTTAGTISTSLLSWLNSNVDGGEKTLEPKMYGNYLCIVVVISYLSSIPFFYLAGREYTKFKE